MAEPSKNPAKDDQQELKQAMFQVSDGVIGAGILVVVGTWSGTWLDGKLNTSPWFSVGLALVGGGFGLFRLVKKAMAIGSMTSKSQATGSLKTDAALPEQTGESPQRKAYQMWDDESSD